MRQRRKDSDRKGSHLLLKTMKTKKKRNKLFLIVASVFAIVFIFSAIMFTREMRQTKQEAQTFAELAALRAPQPDPTVRKTATPTATVSPEPTPISIVIGAGTGAQDAARQADGGIGHPGADGGAHRTDAPAAVFAPV